MTHSYSYIATHLITYKVQLFIMFVIGICIHSLLILNMHFYSLPCRKLLSLELIILTVLKHVVSKDFIFKKSLHTMDWFCILPRMKKSMALFHIKNFSCHVTLLLKRKLQHVSHKWVICESHPDCSVGQ